MNGPIKSDSDKSGTPFDWLEFGIVVAGVLVVSGLLMESWPEIKSAISEGRFPNLTVTGGIIVTVGVLVEVVLGIFITQRANRAQSEANERVAKAEQATAEATERTVNLQMEIAGARERQLAAENSLLDLRRAMARRSEVFDFAKFSEFLQSHDKGKVEIFFSFGDEEAFEFGVTLDRWMKDAGWDTRLFSDSPVTDQQLPPVLALGGQPQGVTVLSKQQISPGSFSETLRNAFGSVGFPIAIAVGPQGPEGAVRIIVGPKEWPDTAPK